MYEQKTAEIVNHVFHRMIAMKPAFKQAWPDEFSFRLTKKEWLKAFIDENITSIEQLKKGLSQLRKQSSPFVPSPGEFIKWCQPEPHDIGAPSIEDAYTEACRKSNPAYKTKQWSHPAVKTAVYAVGTHNLTTYAASKTRPMFEKAYFESCKQYADGKIMDRIENNAESTNTQETHNDDVVKEEYKNVTDRNSAMSAMKNLLA